MTRRPARRGGAAALALLGVAVACARQGADAAPTGSAGAVAAPAPTRSALELPPPDVPLAAPAGIGERVALPEWALTVLKFESCRTPSFLPVRAGHRRVGALLRIEARSDRFTVPANAFYARLFTADGEEVPPTFGGCEPDLRAAQLEAGEQAEGWVNFEVPEAVGGLELRYAPFVLGIGRREARVRLE